MILSLGGCRRPFAGDVEVSRTGVEGSGVFSEFSGSAACGV